MLYMFQIFFHHVPLSIFYSDMCFHGPLMVSYQDDLRKEDFSTMSAPLLYKMIKSKTEFPLHKAIKVEREDVVFLYLIEVDSQVRLPQMSFSND